ncbi:hypothetical protein LX32DRAFT_723833 [Colletotrichum zoysiae]|uniref:Uncharacterized protein n=1 Tax=Colletotrichum zoysiae TaxID=1216348 RepID=A0AAD9HU91_9PEZI|nr:hypothetical protein LX32DRAFT_723833 [Colletotrichum zoysiae]
MHLPIRAAFPLALLVTAARARALVRDAPSPGAPIPGYGIFIPRWEMAAPDSGGGGMLHLSGTVQEVVEQMRGMGPGFDVEAAAPAAVVVGRRGDAFDDINTLCHLFRAGSRSAAQEGVEDLRKVRGRPQNGPGPGNCGRVSCRRNTGIWWCNDAQGSRELASFGDIAEGAQRVLTKCQDKPGAGQGDGMTVSGQAFHMDNWNVVVRGGDNCDDAGVSLNGSVTGN